MNFTNLLQQLLAVAKLDAAKLVLPLIVNFLNSVATNPSAANLTVQLISLEAGLLAVVPHIAQDELKSMATLIAEEATTLLAAPNAAAVLLPSGTTKA